MGAYRQTDGASTPATTPPPMGAQGGKGTSEATPTAGGATPPPPALHGGSSGADWYPALMQMIQGQQAQGNMAGKAPSYADMTAQALNGMKWGDLTPKPAEQPKPAEAAPAAAPAADMQAQLAALQQQMFDRDNQDRVNRQYGEMAGRAATGGAINGYARGGAPDDDDIVKLALNFLRRYRP